jgi:hypothetical protein
MSTLVAPIHTAAVNGRPVRFFRSPFQGPDFPWHALDDLMAATGASRELRRQYLRMVRRDWGKDLRTVSTLAEVLTIAPHFMAQGWVDSLVDRGVVLARLRSDYDAAALDAANVLTAGMTERQSLDYVLAAMSRLSVGQREAH